MGFTVQPQLQAEILRQYEKNMASFPKKRAEVEAFLQEKAEDVSLCLRYLYGHLTVLDMVSFPVALLAGYAEASLAAYGQLEYVKTIPQEIFFAYVLHHRVNSECLDGSRMTLLAEILPHVQGKTMEEAVLAVNYWCYSHATYTPADDRTLGPLAVMRRTLGRCGEESVLAVAALRSVGIPARQCYCPRWSHCDDNHAWVEVWVDGQWHYLGACEPEPVLDRGWFTAAASRAMLVHSKRWSPFSGGEQVLRDAGVYAEVNCTGHYAKTRVLTVNLSENGQPVQGAAVAFQIVNYSEFFTLHQSETDANGCVCFETGLGDLCVTVFHGGKLLQKKVDMRIQETALELDMAEAIPLEKLPQRITMDLMPPAENCQVPLQEENLHHAQKMRQCEQIRYRYMATFSKAEGDEISAYALRESAGNWQQIQAFLAAEGYTLAQKEEVLSTLRPKDFVDITCETLLDALATAEPARGQYSAEIFQDYLLAPRIADEMLQPERAKLRALLPDGFAEPAEVLTWMRQNLQILPDHGVNNYYPSAYGCVFYKQVPEFAFDMVFVALCRAFRFPARLAPGTKEGQWLDATGIWRSIRVATAEKLVRLTLENKTGERLQYFEHFSLGRWDGKGFSSLQYWDFWLEARWTLQLQPGLYRLVTTTRQIDGTASVLLRHIWVDADVTIAMEQPVDQTLQRLRQENLSLPAGPVADALKAGERQILLFAQPGAEPTEHLLQEMLQCAGEFVKENCPIHVFIEQPEARNNATLQRVQAAIHQVQVRFCQDVQAELALHKEMQVGDLRKPFVVLLDGMGRGVYACANYNIRMAQTLLNILKLIAGGN